MALDPVASAALSAQIIKPVFMAFLDFPNEPMRVNTSGTDMSFTGTGEPDIDGFTFLGIRSDVVNIGPVASKSGGSEGVQVTLSGLPTLDQDILDEITQPANWRGREMRMWRIIRDYNNVQQGGIGHLYTGIMTSLNMPTAPDSQSIVVTVEGYLAAYSEPSNRCYLDQEKYDPADLSARALKAIANNSRTAALIGGVGGGSFGGGGGSQRGPQMMSS